MRAFILVALLAMAATVSCQDDPKVSAACSNATEALGNNTAVAAAVANNRQGGCNEIDYDACTYVEATGVWTCSCAGTFVNATSVDAVVTGAGGQSCYIDVRIEIAGNQTYNNATRPATLIASQTNVAYLPLSTQCNATDKIQVFQNFLDAAAAPFNTPFNKSSVAWTSVTISISGCGTERRVTKTFTATGGTTAPPSGTTAPPSGTTAPPTNNNGTTAPTAPPKSGDASVIASSAALVASLIAALAILA